MTKKAFENKKNEIYNRFNLQKSNRTHEVLCSSKLGTLFISCDWNKNIKVASLHTRLEGEAGKFKEWIGPTINTNNGKFNLYFDDPADCLNELTEILDNIEYYNKHIAT